MNPNGQPGAGAPNPQVGNGGGDGSQVGAPNPQVGNGGATANPQVGNAGSGNPQQPQAALTLEQALDALAKTRLENAQHRTEREQTTARLAQLEAELKKRDDASLSELEKAKRDLAEAQQRAAQSIETNQRLRLQVALHALAPNLGIADPSVALAMLLAEHGGKIKYDTETGEPTNLDKLLEQTLQAHPTLAAQASGQPGALPGQPGMRPAASSGPAMNPARGASQPPAAPRDLRTQPLRRFDQIEWKP